MLSSVLLLDLVHVVVGHFFTLVLQKAFVIVVVWWLVLQLPMQSVPLTTKVASSNPADGEVYLNTILYDKMCP